MLPLLILAAAHAQPAATPPRAAPGAPGEPVLVTPTAPVATSRGLDLTLLGGLDRWDTGGGAAGELRLGAGTRRRSGRSTLGLGYGGLLQGWQGPWGLDVHQVRGTWRDRGGLGAEGGVSGSAAGGWGEAMVAPSWERSRERATVGASLGGVLRAAALPSEQLALAPGAFAQVWTRWQASQRLAVDLWSQLRGFGAAAPFASLGVASGALVVEPILPLSVALRTTASAAAPGTAEAVGGLPPAGAVVVRPELELTLWLGSAMAIAAVAGPELGLGASPYTRARGMLGVRGRLGRSRATDPAVPAGTVRLRLDAPHASRVEVLGDFTDWEPVPLVPDRGSWVLDLELAPGVHEYVYRVDGATVVPPEASQTRPDGFGGTNGVLVVRPAST